jgi:asparagine synthase (glutamine-hydrolysing)
MSAICGIYNLDGKPVSRQDMEQMRAALTRNGPDGHGIWCDGPVGLGHLMLHTTPESLCEKLPYQDAGAGPVITADARIDNRQDLFEALGIPGPDRPTMPDSTLILKAYHKWGEDCPNHLLGAFAFTVWDAKEQSLFCCRDQMGFKPFYYYRSRRTFIFASEVKGVLCIPEVPRQLNETAVAHYLVQRHDNREITFYEEILRLPSAHSLVVRPRELKKRRYWRLERSTGLKLGSDTEYAEAVRECMFQAVRSCLRSARPVGVMLSGGLDSSAVACIAARELRKRGERLTAVCSVLPKDHSGSEADEREYMEAVRAQEDNIDLVPVIAEGATPFDDLEDQFKRLDQPGYDPFWYMTEALLAAARERGVRVIMDGFGGDMAVSFLGAGSLAQLVRRFVELTIRRLRGESSHLRSPVELLKTELLAPLLPDWAVPVYRFMSGRKPDEWLSRFAINPVFAQAIRLAPGPRDRTLPIAQELIISAMDSGRMQSDLEESAVRGLSQSVDCRHPLLDTRLMRLCAQIPPGQHFRSGYGRSLIRRAGDGVLPTKVQYRTSKLPFTPDYHRRMITASSRLAGLLSETGDGERAWNYVSKTKIEQVLEHLNPWQNGRHWETDTQRIAGLGITMACFIKWFDKADQC